MIGANLIKPSLPAQLIPVQAQTPNLGSNDPQSASTGVGISVVGFTVIGTLFIAVVAQQIWKKFRSASASAHSQSMPPRLFSTKQTISEVRTKDYFKLDIESLSCFGTSATSDDPQEDTLSDSLLTYSQTKVEACLRSVIATLKIEEIMEKRSDLMSALRDSLTKSLQEQGLHLVDISLGRIDECSTYSENNYFDAKVIEVRSKHIHEAITKERALDLESQLQAKKTEIDSEKQFQALELQLRSEQLKKEAELRKLEIDNSEEIASIEEAAGKKALERNRAMQAVRLDSEKQIYILDEGQKHAIEAEKIKYEIELLRKNKDLINERLEMQQYQAQENNKLEVLELDLLIKLFTKQQEKLLAESLKAKAAEAINTAIEQEKAQCRLLSTQKAAQSASAEADAMNALTAAENNRFQLIPPNDSERLLRAVRDLLPGIIEKLPELLKALAPQPGVLGDSNTYTFPEGSGESVQKLMLSTSGLLFLNTLLEGKLGLIIEQVIDQIKPLNGIK